MQPASPAATAAASTATARAGRATAMPGRIARTPQRATPPRLAGLPGICAAYPPTGPLWAIGARRTAERATLPVRAVDDILGTHSWTFGYLCVIWNDHPQFSRAGSTSPHRCRASLKALDRRIFIWAFIRAARFPIVLPAVQLQTRQQAARHTYMTLAIKLCIHAA